MNTKLAAQAVEFVAASSALTDRLMSEVQSNRAEKQAAAQKLNAVLDRMLETGCVAPHQKQAAAAMLEDHSQSLDLLVNAVNKMQSYKQASEKAASDLGQAVTEKEAGVSTSGSSTDSLNGPYVGRRTSEKKASDLAILAVLDAPRS
jgi:N-acetylmuramoyl-L-alanine amidase CwlA